MKGGVNMGQWDIFRERFIKRRTELNYSIRKLSREIGISSSSISRFELGEVQKISAERIDRVCELLDCDAAYLWGHIDTPQAKVGSPEQEGIDEARLVKKYRRLNEKQKSAVHVVIDSFLDTAQQGKQEDS